MLNRHHKEVSQDLVLGFDESVMATLDGVLVHRGIVDSFTALKAQAADAGFDLRLVSGFRSFDRQLAIWNAKASGQRALLDDQGEVLDWAALSDLEVVMAILRWSALPGASRHHWGTDIDVYDAAAVAPDYQVQLTPAEVADDGVFGPLHRWLDREFAEERGHGFFRPYNVDRGGIAPERWHLSYAPLSAQCDLAMQAELLQVALEQREDVYLKEVILKELANIYQRFVVVPTSCYPSPYADMLRERDLV